MMRDAQSERQLLLLDASGGDALRRESEAMSCVLVTAGVQRG